LVRALQTIGDRMRCIHPVSREILTLADGRTVALVEPIGRGTCGSVYRGVIESNWGVERPVAVKLFETPPEVEHGEVMRRLGRIARRSAAVRHSAVVQLFELDRTDTSDGHVLPFIVTELVDGESLASLVDGWRARSGRVPTDFAVVVALRVAEALGAALFADCPDGSIAGLVHGDLSPRQVLVSNDGEVKVCDFGQSALRDMVSNVRSRTRLAYTAPEVACGAPTDPRSDVFSLGVMMHELLLGPRFVRGTEFGEAVQMVRDGRFHLNVMEPNIPRGLRDVIERALDRTPTTRHSHARSLAFELRREMFKLGLCDASACVRQAVVGFCGVRGPFPSVTELGQDVVDNARQRSDVVPKRLEDDDTAAETRKSKRHRS
jgi:serine/threonine-protein kinase